MEKITVKSAPCCNQKERKMFSGICFYVSGYVLNFICTYFQVWYRWKEFGDIEHRDLQKPNASTASQWEMCYTPINGWGVQHYYMMFKFLDGNTIIDIPMREYTRRDKEIPGKKPGRDLFFYFRNVSSVDIYVMRSSNDLMEAYELSKEESHRVTKKYVKEAEGAYEIDMTVAEFVKKLRSSVG